MSELSYDPSKLTPVQKAALAAQKAKQAEVAAGGFDLRTLIPVEGSQTGEKELRPYTVYIEKGEKLYEQPMASGNLFYPNGEQAGRVEFKDGRAEFDKTAEHITFISEQEEQAKALEELKSTRAEYEAMKKELAAIKAEKDAEAEKAEAKTAKAENKTKEEKK